MFKKLRRFHQAIYWYILKNSSIITNHFIGIDCYAQICFGGNGIIRRLGKFGGTCGGLGGLGGLGTIGGLGFGG